MDANKDMMILPSKNVYNLDISKHKSSFSKSSASGSSDSSEVQNADNSDTDESTSDSSELSCSNSDSSGSDNSDSNENTSVSEIEQWEESCSKNIEIKKKDPDDPQLIVNLSPVSNENVIPPSRYVNHEFGASGFISGVDFSEEKLSKRASRFGIKNSPVLDMTEMCRSLGVNEKSVDVRFDAIHIWGVREMSTGDVFAYFKGFGPGTIEWIDDFSCNVVWQDSLSTLRALNYLSQPIEPNAFVELLASSNSNPNVSSLLTDNDISTDDPKKMEDDSEPCSPTSILSSSKNSDLSKFKVLSKSPSLPEGIWRFGISCSKSECILLRFATLHDVKKQGASKRSLYMLEHARPGVRSIISQSRKRRLITASDGQMKKQCVEDIVFGKMRADEEEERVSVRSRVDEGGPSIRDRLGPENKRDVREFITRRKYDKKDAAWMHDTRVPTDWDKKHRERYLRARLTLPS